MIQQITHKKLLGSTAMITIGMIALAALSSRREAQAQESAAAERVQRGEYLVKVLGCGDCHTPMKLTPMGPGPDKTRLLSGHPETLNMPDPPRLPPGPWMILSAATNTAFSGPWGVSFSANLTPDSNTGMGIWTEEMFFGAMREGKHMGTSRPILPPMPIPAYSNLNDEDLKAVFAYLKSIPPIVNRVPDPRIPGAKPETLPEEN